MKETRNSCQRIAIIGNQSFTLVRFRGALIRALVADGHHVFAFMPDATDADCEAVRALGAEPIGFRLNRTGMNPLQDLATLFDLINKLRRFRVDLTLCYFIKPVIYGTLAARMAGVAKRFALIEGAGTTFSDERGVSLKSRMLRKVVVGLYSSALRHAHKVFFLNKDDQQLFADDGMVPLSRTVVIPGIGIDLSEYRAAPVPDGPVTFVMLTRLLGQKGVREYAAAARLVKQKFPETRFVLLGGLETNPDRIAETEVQGWVAEGVLEWPGHVADVQAWLAAAHVFVLPSYYREGLPRSALEAMAKGRAIITTDSVGCRETVRHNENGLLVPPRDASTLAEAMKQLIDSPERTIAMGQASRAMAEECFDVDVVNRLFMKEMGLAGPK